MLGVEKRDVNGSESATVYHAGSLNAAMTELRDQVRAASGPAVEVHGFEPTAALAGGDERALPADLTAQVRGHYDEAH
jgi:ABC-type molybdate transport system substrate-binding protein